MRTFPRMRSHFCAPQTLCQRAEQVAAPGTLIDEPSKIRDGACVGDAVIKGNADGLNGTLPDQCFGVLPAALPIEPANRPGTERRRVRPAPWSTPSVPLHVFPEG
jgi:hypothetical protein